MVGLFCLYFVTLLTIGVNCDMLYFNNDTTAELLQVAQVDYRQNCPMLPGAVVIVMVGTTTRDEVWGGCKERPNIPVDKIAVKHLISQANNNNSSQLIYLFTDDEEVTQGNTVILKNLTKRQWACVLSRYAVVILKPKGVKVNSALPLTPVSLQIILAAEYTQGTNNWKDNKDENIFSITPSPYTLISVVNYFIRATGWTRIGLLYDDIGSKLSREFANSDIEIYALNYDDSNAYEVYSHFKNYNVRIIMFVGSVRAYLQALDDLYDYYYTGTG